MRNFWLMDPQTNLIPTGRAARQLGVGRATVLRWIASGKLSAVTLPSGQFRIRQADVDAIVNGKQAKAAAR